ncbi:MAG: phosphodiester glycosidase family protein [Oligoflexia bacterium]|nr:phosphodiester glycosidase family protein [Oligoflexia bacterium]
MLGLLDTFGSVGEASAGTLAGSLSDKTGPSMRRDLDAREVEQVLGGEVDTAQAAMFARRLLAVMDSLGNGAADRLLLALLRGRLGEILAGTRPVALRVRALIDFVYSQHARLMLGGRGPSPEDLLGTPDWVRHAPGVEQADVAGGTDLGPQRLHILRLDPGKVRLRCVDRRDAVAVGQDLAAHSREVGAVAALSGGYFLYSEDDIRPWSQRTDPVGLLVDDGRVCSPPLFARSCLVERGGRWSIAVMGLQSATLRVDRTLFPVDIRTVFTRARANVVPSGGVAIVGDRVVASSRRGEPIAVPLNGVVIAHPLPRGLSPKSVLSWQVPGVQAAMSGGPLLVSEGQPIADLAASPLPSPQLVAEDFRGTAPPRTFSQDETGDRNLLPRLAVGLDRDGRLLALAVDGRDLGGALGLTLRATARVMAALGCVRAMNLDGGSSKRMVVGGAVVDHPSTEILGAGEGGATPIRPVHTAIFALPR